MASEPDNLVLSILRDIQATLVNQGRDLEAIKTDLRRHGETLTDLCRRLQQPEKNR
jgi:hypothetical protein